MPALDIVVEADGAWPDLKGAPHGVLERVGGLRAGMQSGRPSVSLVVRLDDGRLVFAETSMRLFLGAATVFRERYADDLADDEG